MKNFKLTIEYDGSKFFGWQRQKDIKVKTVQGLLDSALTKFCNQEIRTIGSGRTDRGVHAKGQVANFLTENEREPYQILKACEGLLPQEISVYKAEEVPLDFHARYSAKLKTYEYLFYTSSFRSALYFQKAWWLKNNVNWALVKNCLKYFEGTHDFIAFQNKGSDIIKTVRTIETIHIEDLDKNLKKLTITGNGFLRNMVRILVGTLICVGTGRMEEKLIEKIFKEKVRYNAGPMAEAGGLYLKEVKY